MAEELTKEPEQVLPSVDEMQEQLNALSDQNRKLAETNERILTESKSHAEKWRNYRDSASEAENVKLLEEKNWKALMEKQKGENAVLNERMEAMRRRTLKKTLDFEVARYASDANDVTDIINSLPGDLVKIDEESMTIDGVSDAVNSLREMKPYLFKKHSAPETVNAKPGFVANAPAPTIDELKIDDKINLLKDALTESYKT